MKKLILLFFLFSVSLNAANLKIVPVQQKALSNGNAYGLESGIYFELTNLEPFIMYKLQYSEDLRKWTDLVHLGTYKMAMTSPYWTWDELPPHQCFFRIVVAWYVVAHQRFSSGGLGRRRKSLRRNNLGR